MDKIKEAQDILTALGLPRAQQNERSALVLLALCGIRAQDRWSDSRKISLTVRLGIMEFIAVEYGKVYKENSRESIRRQTLHQFHQAKVIDYNPDDPLLPTNSSKAHYAITPGALKAIKLYGSTAFDEAAKKFKAINGSLSEIYARHHKQNLVPVTFQDGSKIELSPGKHNEVQAAIIQEFAPRFAPGAQVLYLGDTMKKDLLIDQDTLKKLGLPVTSHDKLPDVVLYQPQNDWLYLIEAVTAHGPMSPKRIHELENLLSNCKSGKVFVTAFPDFSEFRKWSKEIAWDTEVWIVEVPDHLIHYNGDRFFGPR